MIIKVLGTGCTNCKKLEALATEAAAQIGVAAEIVKVTDMKDIMGYGVMSTPALVVDEQLKLAGRVPALEQVVTILEAAK